MGQWRQQQTNQKEQTDNDRGQSRTATTFHTRRAFDKAGGGRCAEQCANRRCPRVRQQRLTQTRQVAVFVHQVSPSRHRYQGASGIKDINEQQGQDDAEHGNIEGGRNIELHEYRRSRRRCGNNTNKFRLAAEPTDQRHQQHANNHRTAITTRRQSSDRKKTHQGHDRREGDKVTQADQGGWILDDDTGIFHRNEGQEKADASGHPKLQVARDGIDQPRPNWQQTDDHKQDARDENRSQRCLPRLTRTDHDRVSKESVLAHTRCHADGVIRHDAHDERAKRCGTAGRNEDRAEIHACIRQNQRIHDGDVGHGQERR